MKDLNRKIVEDLWDDMQSRFRFKVLDKNKSSTMRLIGNLLQIMGVQSRKTFMSRYAVTFRDKVYIPFEIGGGNYWHLVGQVCNVVHEAHHVICFHKSPFKFPVRYLVSSTARAHYEMEAMRARMEMYRYLTGRMLEPSLVAGRLKAYACRQKDIDVTRKSLEAVYKVIERGGVVTETAQYAIQTLERNGKDIGKLPIMYSGFDKSSLL